MTSRQLCARLFFIAAVATAGPLPAQGTASGPAIPRTNAVDAEAFLAAMRLASGIVPDDIESLEYQLARASGHGSALRAITELGFAQRGFGPALRATTDDPTIMLLVYQAAHDTAGVRETIATLDAARARLAVRNLPPPLTMAQAELSIGDSAAALMRLVAFERSWTTMEQQVSWGMVQNGWLLRRTWIQLGELARAMGRPADAGRAWSHLENANVPVAEPVPGPVVLRAAPEADAGARYRYDAVLWMQPTAIATVNASRPLARLGFVTTERSTLNARGFTTTQTYDSIILDMPMLDHLGAEGLGVRRQIQAAAGTMTGTTDGDTLGRATNRSLQGAGSLPDELRGLLERGLGFGPLSGAVALTGRAVSVGDSWRDSIALSIPGTATATVTLQATYRLARVTSAGGRRLAFITIEAATSGAQAQPDGGRVQATLTGELVRDITTGESLRLAASLRASVVAATGAVTPVRVLMTALREAPSPSAAMVATR